MKSKESKETENSTINFEKWLPELGFSLQNPQTYGGIPARIIQYMTLLGLISVYDFVSNPLPYQQMEVKN